eukprot:scaffold454_cov124-Isochrysis_galbana.AAC.18
MLSIASHSTRAASGGSNHSKNSLVRFCSAGAHQAHVPMITRASGGECSRSQSPDVLRTRHRSLHLCGRPPVVARPSPTGRKRVVVRGGGPV